MSSRTSTSPKSHVIPDRGVRASADRRLSGVHSPVGAGFGLAKRHKSSSIGGADLLPSVAVVVGMSWLPVTLTLPHSATAEEAARGPPRSSALVRGSARDRHLHVEETSRWGTKYT